MGAPSVRVDRPVEGKPAAGHAVDDRLRLDLDALDATELRRVERPAGDLEERLGGHGGETRTYVRFRATHRGRREGRGWPRSRSVHLAPIPSHVRLNADPPGGILPRMTARAEPIGPLAEVPAAERFDNRELSWLEFNARVLALAEGRDAPLLERVKFLAIFSSNLDEFFQIRVAGLKEQVGAGLTTTSPDGMTAREQLDADQRARPHLMARQHRVVGSQASDLVWRTPASASSTGTSSTAPHRMYLRERFEERIFPVLTPLSVDPAHPFPYISNLSLNLAVVVREPETRRRPVRAGEGAAVAPAVHGAARRRPLRPDRAGDRGVDLDLAVPGDGGHRGASVPRDAGRRPRARDRRSRRPPRGDRVGAPAARTVAGGRPPRGPPVDAEGLPRAPAAGAGVDGLDVYVTNSHARPRRLWAADRARPARPQVRAVDRA